MSKLCLPDSIKILLGKGKVALIANLSRASAKITEGSMKNIAALIIG